MSLVTTPLAGVPSTLHIGDARRSGLDRFAVQLNSTLGLSLMSSGLRHALVVANTFLRPYEPWSPDASVIAGVSTSVSAGVSAGVIAGVLP